MAHCAVKEESMKSSLATMAACALLALAGCGREDANTAGNGPGDADGLGGRTDPQSETTTGQSAPGRLSEATPPSAPANDSMQGAPMQAEPSADTTDQSGNTSQTGTTEQR